jgi:hypothetical protein
MTPGFNFIGTMAGYTAYRMKGSDKIIIRSKGGPSKHQLKRSHRFVNTRLNNTEFALRSRATKFFRRVAQPMLALADHNVAGKMNALLKHVQYMDPQSAKGQRNVCTTLAPQLLEGFSFNRSNAFDSIVRSPLTFSIDREAHSARVEIPALVPGLNLVAPGSFPWFSFVISFGAMPDVFYHTSGYKYHRDYEQLHPTVHHTEWQHTGNGSGAITLDLPMKYLPPDALCSLVLSVGIRFGVPDEQGGIRQLKSAGAGKVVMGR